MLSLCNKSEVKSSNIITRAEKLYFLNQKVTKISAVHLKENLVQKNVTNNLTLINLI